ncbi:regulatory protein, luxR family [Saccharopolyspora kobensis]|uniref:Regulatory protein, luxR family n=1 Tax=Saccharopolyspora kobensis TaxID=146035 RepID=A0A1H6CAD1_9PSEU|nr:AAA family ATPase [Saccharopolyspora kobensis]SEG69717.1 regulatory protein, luxR family [Saccharopolyspora kobensis]SFC33311.1 regulatory protein, luxR family [Saccharopolyspora kobensis]
MLIPASAIQPGERALPTLPQVTGTGDGPVHVSARTAAPGVRSIGRDDVIARVIDVCDRPAIPAVVVTGPAGTGRSTVLARVREKLVEAGIATAEIRIPSAVSDLPNLVTRFSDGLGLPLVRDECARTALSRVVSSLAARRDRLVVFLDDAHRLGSDARTALSSSISALAGSPVTFVCAARALDPDVAALVHEERLRPLSASAVEELLTDLLRAKPAPGLARSIRNSCAGIPAVVRAAVEGYQRAGSLRIVDQQAHLVRSAAELPVAHPLFAELKASWPVIKALAVLHPLGSAAPALIAEAVDTDEQAVDEVLHELREAGVVLPGRPAGSWRFRAPMLATLLTACLGPFERRLIAQLAVNALQQGRAICLSPDYLPERLVDAGKPADPERTAATLLSAAARTENGERADRWLWAAAGLFTDPARRAEALHQHAVTCARHRRFGSAVQSAEIVLRSPSDHLTPDSSQELLITYVIGLAGSGATAALQALVEDGRGSVPGGEENRITTRAAALYMLNRWQEAREALADHAPTSEVLSRTLSLAGWLDVPAPSTAIGASFAGRWDEALDLARADLAAASAHVHGPERTATYRELAGILTARGQLNRARAVLDDARSQHLLLPHLLAVPEAELESTLGATLRAKNLIEEALRFAAGNGITAGTDELWLRLAETEAQAGNPAAARRCANRLQQVADQLGTTAARRSALLARLLVQPDPRTAAEVMELAKARNRPFELASTFAAVAGSAAGTQKLVHTAYEMFGELDALIPRARLRNLMRARNMTVPGRSATVAENERLLAALITEGLTNSQLATVLGTSEKSVEGRLTRFFNKTGYRSRTELAAATLNGTANPAA